MSYSTYDFTESVDRAQAEYGFALADIAEVVAAHGGSSEGGGEWSGGFLLRLKDERYAYLSGWCDYTGWGCQDGIDCTFFTERPELISLADIREGTDDDGESWGWDENPEDLNRIVRGETTIDDDSV